MIFTSLLSLSMYTNTQEWRTQDVTVIAIRRNDLQNVGRYDRIALYITVPRKRGLRMTAEEIERKHQEDLERIRKFRLMDDDFMTKCFEEKPEYIQLVLRIIMDIPDLEVVDVRTQVFVENLLNRSVRLDVKAHDTRGRWMNVEIQRKDHGAGRKRARYNSSMMDVGLLEKGADFEDLPEVWVIFITENDVIGRGEPVYQIERCDIKTGDRFHDGSHILYVNGSYRGNDDLGKLMHDFSCTNGGAGEILQGE